MIKKRLKFFQLFFTFIFILMLLFLADCFDKKPSANLINNSINSQLLNGYFLKNNINLSEDIACLLINSSEDFENYFSIAKTMSNEIINPDFKENFILAIAVKETIKNTDISINNIKKNKSTLFINFNIAAGKTNTYTSTPCIVFSVPKDNKIKFIDFIQNGISIKKITR